MRNALDVVGSAEAGEAFMARSSLLGGLGRLLGPGDEGAEDLRAERDAARAEAVRAAAHAAAQTRRGDAAQAALEAVRARLDALEMELYVARSDQQRAVVVAEDLRAELAALKVKEPGV